MRSAETIANRAGTAGLLLYCLGIMSWEDMLVGGQWLMVIAMALVIPRIYRSLLRDRLFQLSLLFYIYLLLHAGVLLYKDPALGGRILQDVPAYFRMGFFQALMIGFWWAAMAEQRRLSWPLWALISGYCLRILLDWPNEDWSQGIPAKLGFGLYYTLFGAFSALVATWMVVQLIRAADTQRTLAANFGLSVLGVISLLGLAYSSSRGAVLGFLCAFPLILYQWWRGSSRTVARWKPAAAGVAAMLILAIVVAGGPITERDPGGGGEMGLLLEQGLDDYKPEKVTAIGTRFVVWREGLRYWWRAPLFGKGPVSTKDLLYEVGREYRIDKVNDFHNTYLEVLVRLGVIGGFFYLAHLILCAASFRRGKHQGWYGWEVATFLLAGGVLFAVTLIFKEGTLDPRGGAVTTFFLGGLYAFAASQLLPANMVRRGVRAIEKPQSAAIDSPSKPE